MQREAGQQPVLAEPPPARPTLCCRPRWTPTAASTKPSEENAGTPVGQGVRAGGRTAGFEPATPCSQSQFGRCCHLRGWGAAQVGAGWWLSVVVRSGPFRTAVNGTLVARPSRTTPDTQSRRWLHPDRRVRPVLGDNGLVGKPSQTRGS
jgi:hypothetical protein